MDNHKHKSTNNGVQNIMKALLDMPTGMHTILVYPDLMTIREMYTKYVSMNGNKKTEMFVILPFYETVDHVMINLLNQKDSLSKYNEITHNGSVVVRDCHDILNGDFNMHRNSSTKGDTEVSKLAHFLNDTLLHAQELGKKVVTIWIDTGAFYFNQRGYETLLNYEQQIAAAFKNTAIKQVCLYHQKDFELRLAGSQEKQILDAHDKRLIMLDNS